MFKFIFIAMDILFFAVMIWVGIETVKENGKDYIIVAFLLFFGIFLLSFAVDGLGDIIQRLLHLIKININDGTADGVSLAIIAGWGAAVYHYYKKPNERK